MAEEKSLAIIIKARDEASKEMMNVQKSTADLVKKVGLLAAGIAGFGDAANLWASAVELASAKTEIASGIQKKNFADILEAQLKAKEAVAEYGNSIPVIGEAIKRVVDVWGDKEGTKKAIENIKSIQAEIERTKTLLGTLGDEITLKELELRDAPASARLAERIRQRGEDLKKQISVATKAEVDAAEALGEQIAKLATLRLRGKGGGFDPKSGLRTPTLPFTEQAGATRAAEKTFNEARAQRRELQKKTDKIAALGRRAVRRAQKDEQRARLAEQKKGAEAEAKASRDAMAKRQRAEAQRARMEADRVAVVKQRADDVATLEENALKREGNVLELRERAIRRNSDSLRERAKGDAAFIIRIAEDEEEQIRQARGEDASRRRAARQGTARRLITEARRATGERRGPNVDAALLRALQGLPQAIGKEVTRQLHADRPQTVQIAQ